MQKHNIVQKMGTFLAGLTMTGGTLMTPGNSVANTPPEPQQPNRALPTVVDLRGNPEDLAKEGNPEWREGFDKTAKDIEEKHKDKINHFITLMPDMVDRLVRNQPNKYPNSTLDNKNYDTSQIKIEVVSDINLRASVHSPSTAYTETGKPPVIEISTGLLAALDDEHEVAAVFAHELEHWQVVQQPHTRNRSIVKFNDGTTMSRRQDEANADRATVERLHNAGYRPGAMVNVMRKFTDIKNDTDGACQKTVPKQDSFECVEYKSPYPEKSTHGTNVFRANNILSVLDAFCQKGTSATQPCPEETKKGLADWRKLRSADDNPEFGFKGTRLWLQGQEGLKSDPAKPIPKM